jgi:L-ribulose-5-phosphate 3-epimerase
MPQDLSRRGFMKTSLTVAGAAGLGLSGHGLAFADTAGRSSGAAQIAGGPPTLVGKVHKAVQLRMLPKQLSYPDRFRVAREAGFHYVEAYTVTHPAEAEAIRKAADSAGIQIHGVTNGLWTEWPLSSPDPAIVAKRLAAIRSSLQQARLYGATTVLVVPALVTPQVTYQEAWTRSQKSLRSVLPFAAKERVIIAAEEVWDKFLLSPLEFATYVDQFNSPWLRAYFDVGNVMPFGYPQDWIRTLGRRIAKIHLKDYDPKTHRLVNLGDGAVDWRAVRQALIDIRYKGIVTAELAPGDEAYLRDIADRMDKLVLY